MDDFMLALGPVRQQNADGQSFVPDNSLPSILPAEVVRKILSETQLEHHRIEEIVNDALRGAQKTFAILVTIKRPELILSFIENDQMQPLCLDQKLPLELQKLLTLLGDALTAAQFYSKQWEFIAPVFSLSSLSRNLEKETVLPFSKSEKLGEGGFGTVWKIRIHSSHHSFPYAGHDTFVVKEMKSYSTTNLDYQLELRNLSILKLIKHPCIIRLLTCFTYQGKHNFIFPLADGGSLADVLEGKRPPAFQTEEDVLFALCGISSAIRTVHAFQVGDFEQIGCHHDLKPSNILLSGKSLLLSDFGLSRFKDAKEDSRSNFRAGRGDYLAPECEDLEGDFKKHEVHRSSDVWSFGCIIAELLTFQLKGLEGVSLFRSSRMFEIDGVNYYRFHRGPAKPNPSVWKWISNLRGGLRSDFVAGLQQTLSISLQHQPEKRSDIATLDRQLRFVTTCYIAGQVMESFASMIQMNDSIIAQVERARFESWKWTIESLNTAIHSHEKSFLSTENFCELEAAVSVLKELNQTLQATGTRAHTPRERVLLPIRRLNDVLHDTLPKCCRATSQTHLECLLLEYQDDAGLKELEELKSQHSALNDHIGQLAAIRRMKALVEVYSEAGEDRMALKPSALERTGWLQDFYIGKLTEVNHQPCVKSIIVEMKNYDDHYALESVANELFARLRAICCLLNSAQTLRVLPCCGYYHDSDSYSLGIVYSYPEQEEGQEALCTGTLHSILQDDFQGQHRPLLGDRFRLARGLASSILEFHKVNWAQKAISAFNVVFFRPPTASWKFHMDQPYFMGFLSSRKNDEFSFTEGPTEDQQHARYLHPLYREDGKRFQQHYDYYSLGIVLLELGLWRTLEAMTKSTHFQGTPQEFARAILQIAVPRLGQTMGAVYQKVVEDCLRWEPKQDEKAGDNCSSLVCLRFHETVLEKLASCRA